MFNKVILKNGLTLITVSMPHLDSVTTLVAVGAGSRYETRKINGISHFLEHMFFKGSRKYPTAEQISTLVDGIGAINNAFTGREYTGYWIKSSTKHIELAADIISSMLSESLLAEEEIEREKGVIIEELRMYRDNPAAWVGGLFYKLIFGDTPMGWDVIGEEEIIRSVNRENFLEYMSSIYSPKNMVLVFAGKLPKNIRKISEKYFLGLPEGSNISFKPYKKRIQSKPKVNIFYKKTDQANLILGVEGFSRQDEKRYIAGVLSVILGSGMSSRLFLQVRERRGLAYHVSASHDSYYDTGVFVAYGGLKLEKVEEGLEVIRAELERAKMEKVGNDELNKAKDMIRGRLAISMESTNFLAEYFGLQFALDRKIETFEEYLQKIDAVSAEDVQAVAKELFLPQRFNLQIIGPFKSISVFEKLLH